MLACLLLAFTLEQPTISNIRNVSDTIGCKVQNVSWYQNMDKEFNFERARLLVSNGIKPTLYLQPIKNKQGVPFRAINNGRYDSYFLELARKIKNLNNTFYFSFAPEIAEWQPYKFTNENTPQDFINAYRRVVRLFKQQGANKVKFLWTVNARYIGDKYSFSTFFPGESYVDYVTITAFNWVNINAWDTPRTAADIFAPNYYEMTDLTEKPIFISETSSIELIGDKNYKANWIKDLFYTVCNDFPKIERITWFNILEIRSNWIADWRFNTSEKSIQAFRDVFANDGNPCK